MVRDGSNVRSTTEVEEDLRFLLMDTRSKADPQIFDYVMALDQKIFSVRFLYFTCKRAVEGLLAAFKMEMEDTQNIVMNETFQRYRETAAHFETFLHFICATFDVLAKLTPYFYPTDSELRDHVDYFRDQMNYFIQHEGLDPEYAEVLAKSKEWIDIAFDNRNAFAHNFSVFMGFASDGHVTFQHRESDEIDRERNFESVADYLTKTTEKLYAFLDAYTIIQRKKMPESERTRMFREAREKQRSQAKVMASDRLDQPQEDD